MAEYWLALGQVEEALREFSGLPASIQSHPEVIRMRQRFDCLPPAILELWLSNPNTARKRRKRALAS